VLPAPTPRTPREPQRTCVGCRIVASQHLLVRVAFDGPRLVVDRPRRVAGRGAYIHPLTECITAAGRGGIARSLRRAVKPDDVKRIVAEMSRTDDIAAAIGDPLPSDPNRENVAGLGATKTVEPPPHGVVTDSELN